MSWLPPNTESSKSQGRGGGEPASCTWRDWAIADLEIVDGRLSALDEQSEAPPHDPSSITSFFSVLKLACQSGSPAHAIQNRRDTIYRPLTSVGTDWTAKERFLLDHYVKKVAPQMMPFKRSGNPWATHYTSLALQSDGVRNALLAQTAAHLWNLRDHPTDRKLMS